MHSYLAGAVVGGIAVAGTAVAGTAVGWAAGVVPQADNTKPRTKSTLNSLMTLMANSPPYREIE
jgi:branched-subunit amino acid ABC-type transport system permease component